VYFHCSVNYSVNTRTPGSKEPAFDQICGVANLVKWKLTLSGNSTWGMIFEILKSSLSVRLGAGGSDFLAKGAASDLAGKNSIFKDPRRLWQKYSLPFP